jgi:hypothetical protein
MGESADCSIRYYFTSLRLISTVIFLTYIVNNKIYDLYINYYGVAFKAPAISSANSGDAPMPAAVVIAVVIAVAVNVAEFGMACSRDAATHFLGPVFPKVLGRATELMLR